MSIDVTAVADSMIDAARAEVADRWPQLQVFAETEFRRLAQSYADIAAQLAEGQLDEVRARQHAIVHQLTARQILKTVEGLGILTAEQALQAGVRAASKVVNGVVKFALL